MARTTTNEITTAALRQERLAALYLEHSATLLRTAQRLLDSHHLAEEAVHEAFVRFDRASQHQKIDSDIAFLRTVVKNVAKSMLRRKLVADRIRPEYPRYEPGPEEQFVRHDQADLVRNACAALPDKQREVLRLRYWDGLSESQIAEHLSISNGSVKTHASRGRQTLKESLGAVLV